MGKKSLIQHESTWKSSIHILDVDNLRKATPVGAYIQFEKKVDGGDAIYHKQQKMGIISGVIQAKYPNVFMLEDGRTFSWKDYYLGKIK